MDAVKRQKHRREALREMVYRRRYVWPNLVTLSNMFCGYIAVFHAATGRFEKALVAIALAIVFDGLDGRVARKLNATSEFGMEFDSFSDVVSFGVAPAVLMYYWGLRDVADEFGVFVTFVYLLCAASRLARFNLSTENLAGFTGLPTPGAAAAVIATVYSCLGTDGGIVRASMSALLMTTLAFLMISKVEYLSIKMIKFQRVKALGRLLIGVLVALIWYSPKLALFGVSMSYCISGPAGLARMLSKRAASRGQFSV